MNRTLKEALGYIVRYSGISALLRIFICRNKVTILVYHKPSADTMRKHLQYLSGKYNFINMGDFISANSSVKWANLPKRSLIVTFDDGHKSNYDLLGVFREFKIRPVIYICSGIVDTVRKFWWMTEGLRDEKTIEELKEMSSSSREKYLESLNGFNKEKESSDGLRQSLNKSEIDKMSPYVDWGSHSQFHPVLTGCTYRECEKEIIGSGREIEALTKKKCLYFSYPNGNYTQREKDIVEKAGYLCARTVLSGWNDRHTDHSELKVQEIADNASINWLCAQISGISWLLKRWFRVT